MSINRKFKAIIIDDDKAAISSLELLLEHSNVNVELCAYAENVRDGINLINEIQPDLIFLDIELPDGNGFNILESVAFKNFQVIFITAFEKYAVKAFEFAAVHYLIKPISRNVLEQAIMKLESISAKHEQYAMLKYSLEKKFYKIALPTSDELGNKLVIIELNNIVRFESINNYTTVYLEDNQTILISKTLKKVELLLSKSGFFRIHQKHLVNLSFVTEIVRTKSPQLYLKDGTCLPVSESRKKDFYQIFEENVFKIS